MHFEIGEMTRQDWGAVRTIYGEGLATGLAAFMVDPPRWEDWDAGHLAIGRFIARDGDARVLGWSALAPVADN